MGLDGCGKEDVAVDVDDLAVGQRSRGADFADPAVLDPDVDVVALRQRGPGEEHAYIIAPGTL
jgi:hypothetical protein